MRNFLSAVLATAVLCVPVSCKKSEPSAQSMLEARWKSEQVGYDKNGNGILDPSERGNVDSLNEYKLFNSDGTGDDIGANFGAYPIPFYWLMSANNQYLAIQDTSTKNNTIVYYHIDSLTSTRLILRDTAGGVATWNVFTKQ